MDEHRLNAQECNPPNILLLKNWKYVKPGTSPAGMGALASTQTNQDNVREQWLIIYTQLQSHSALE